MNAHRGARKTIASTVKIKRNSGTKPDVGQHFFRLQRKKIVCTGYDGQRVRTYVPAIVIRCIAFAMHTKIYVKTIRQSITCLKISAKPKRNLRCACADTMQSMNSRKKLILFIFFYVRWNKKIRSGHLSLKKRLRF